jgi:uncharacterized membrane protein YcaP (DUF421 family)
MPANGALPLEGVFADAAGRRLERRWQAFGRGALVALIAAALAGLVGERGIVLRTAAVYAFLLAVFRVAGRRTLAQVTNFDLILVLIIGDATQQAILGEDRSLVGAALAVSTLVLMDVGLSLAKRRWPRVDAVVDGLPLPVWVSGVARERQMASEGVTRDDLLAAARETHGLARLEQIEHAVLEASGGISIVPRPGGPAAGAAATAGAARDQAIDGSSG